MSNRLDFSVHDPKGRLTLLVDVKRVRDTSEEWAAQWRLFLVSEGYLDTECMHMLVVPDFIYLWPADVEPDVGPKYILDGKLHFGKYYEEVGLSADRISSPAFEHLVGWWLRNLADKVHMLSSEASLAELRRVGLLQILAGSRVVNDALKEAV